MTQSTIGTCGVWEHPFGSFALVVLEDRVSVAVKALVCLWSGAFSACGVTCSTDKWVRVYGIALLTFTSARVAR